MPTQLLDGKMELKVFFSLDTPPLFPLNVGTVSYEYGERFHQEISTM
jgi:hypothetical protein